MTIREVTGVNTVEEFRYLVLALQREGNRALNAQLRPLGLTTAQAETLRVLAERAPLSLSELGGLLVCESGGSPSRLVDRLVAVGLVDRSMGTDRRSVRLELTAKGAELAAQVAIAEEGLYAALRPLLDGQPIEPTLATLRAVAAASPAGQALARRMAS
jgi:DNA-binding MarR family transcriptional regulator